MVLRDQSATPGARKHQRDVQQVEDHDADQECSRSAKELPARDAEQDLHNEVEKRDALQVESEARAPCHGKQRDIGLVMNDIKENMRQYREANCGPDVGTPHRFAEAPRKRREKDAREYRMGVREEIQMDSIGSGADVFYSQIGEQNPEKLNRLNGDQERPETHSRIFFLENKRG